MVSGVETVVVKVAEVEVEARVDKVTEREAGVDKVPGMDVRAATVSKVACVVTEVEVRLVVVTKVEMGVGTVTEVEAKVDVAMDTLGSSDDNFISSPDSCGLGPTTSPAHLHKERYVTLPQGRFCASFKTSLIPHKSSEDTSSLVRYLSAQACSWY